MTPSQQEDMQCGEEIECKDIARIAEQLHTPTVP
jgi:hypothetical protein